MLEIVFVIGATVVTLVALTSAVVLSLRNIDHAKRSSQANKIVQKKLEAARIYRDQQGFDWATSGISCRDNITSSSTGSEMCAGSCDNCSVWEPIASTGFNQQIEIESVVDEKKIITVRVAWGENNKHIVDSQTIISKWEKHE